MEGREKERKKRRQASKKGIPNRQLLLDLGWDN